MPRAGGRLDTCALKRRKFLADQRAAEVVRNAVEVDELLRTVFSEVATSGCNLDERRHRLIAHLADMRALANRAAFEKGREAFLSATPAGSNHGV
jgi:hypothetical protein